MVRMKRLAITDRITALARTGRAFLRSKRGNVAIITALAMIPMCFLAGFGVDYGTAVDRQSQMNAIADAAALAAVTPTMMSQSTTAAQTAAQNTFNAQAAAVSNINWNNGNLTVTISTSGAKRTVTVSYATTYNTYFASLLGKRTLNLSGSSTATGGNAPNIDFYLLLDDSPSMAVAATQSGISKMVSLTQNFPSSYQSCAFGCHEQNPQTQYPSRRNQEDLYTLARNNSVTLRIDLVSQAAQNLMSTAQTTESTNNASYRMAIYSFDLNYNTIQKLTSSLTTAASSAANVGILEVYSQGCLTQSNCNNDTDTDFQNALSNINTTMPNPGSGTNNKGDTPQEVLFLVTDGVDDVTVGSTPSLSSAYGSYYNSSRQQSTINPLDSGGNEPNTDWCTTIKNRGIRIAVLYTQYLPLPTNAWYNTYIAPITSPQDNIAGRLQACASPGLYYEVTTGGDISAALQSLFQYAVQSAYLSQ